MRKFLLICFSCLSFAQISNAAVISYSYTAIDGSFDSNASLLDYIDNASVVNSSNVSSFTLVNSQQSSVNHVSISLDLSSLTDLTIFAGLDASYGAEIYVNGVQVFDTTSDLWWRRNWANNNVVSNSDDYLGSITIDVVWAELCCGGQSSLAFSSGVLGGTLTELTVANLELLESASVPDSTPPASTPPMLMMFSIVLCGLLLRKKKSKLK